MNAPNLPRAAVWVAGLGIALATAGCKTVDPTAVTNFAASVAAGKSQADDALNSVASLTLSESVVYAAAQPTLAEASFVVIPSADTISAWDDALSSMAAYAQNLSSLVSPEIANQFDTAATNLYNQFYLTANQLSARPISSQPGLNTLLATAFTSLANAIIAVKSQTTAVKMASATDTNVAAICNLLAAEIGLDHTTLGLRKTVYEAVWTPMLDRLSAKFLAATSAEKLTLAQAYADALAKRGAADQILASVRRSLLALRDAHHLLAQGEPASIQAELNIVAGEIQHTRDLYNEFSGTPKK